MENTNEILKNTTAIYNSLNRLTNLYLFWLRLGQYMVIWTVVSICIGWIILPVLFLWTGDYWYLKAFGTVPFISIAMLFVLYGLKITFDVKDKSITSNKQSNQSQKNTFNRDIFTLPFKVRRKNLACDSRPKK